MIRAAVIAAGCGLFLGFVVGLPITIFSFGQLSWDVASEMGQKDAISLALCAMHLRHDDFFGASQMDACGILIERTLIEMGFWYLVEQIE